MSRHKAYESKGMFGRTIPSQSNGLIKLSEEEYKQQMIRATEREKTKLFQSEEYKQAVRKKGSA